MLSVNRSNTIKKDHSCKNMPLPIRSYMCE